MRKKETLYFAVFFAGVLGLFFWDMLRGQTGYFHGDYKQQYYPWAHYLNTCVRHFSLPLWAPEIGCGFPLLAEGQIGAFYPLHWILFLLLPFPLSYHAGFLILFLLAGGFTYLFARRFGLGACGASLAVVVFLFGSSYGGFFDGLVAFRTLVFFPLSLYWVDKLTEDGRWRTAVLLAFSFCFAIFGGHAQMACYSMGAATLYFFAKSLFLNRPARLNGAGPFFAALALGVGLAACQILPTLELISQSSRAAATVEFALEKSMNPLSLATVFWPAFGTFFGSELYAGIAPLCLAVFALRAAPKDRKAVFLAVFGLFFVLLSFGRYNPLYVLFLKYTPLRFFRLPFKFIIFSAFAFSLLAGTGFDRLLAAPKEGRTKFMKTAVILFTGGMLLYGASHFIPRNFEPQLMQWAEGYVRSHVYGRPGHPYTWESYSERLSQTFQVLSRRTGFMEPYFLSSLALWAVLLIFSWLAFFKKNIGRKALFFVVMALTLTDLYRYMDLGTGFRGNRVPTDEVESDEISNYLSSGAAAGSRAYEMLTDSEPAHPRWLPDSNLLFGYSTVGLYSPLATDAYREYLKEVGDVDNSTGFYLTTRDKVEKNLGLLGLMNVRYVVSRLDLGSVPGLSRMLQSSKGDILYEYAHPSPRAFLDSGAEVDGQKMTAHVSVETSKDFSGVVWEKSSALQNELKVSVASPAFLFLSDTFYPGWTARLDGVKTPIYKTNEIFQGIPVPAGTHRVEFRYEPGSFKAGVGISVLCLFLVLFLLFRDPSRAAVKR